MKKKLKNNKGFGLIELLVVIGIIALLSTIAMVSLNGAKQKARDAKRIADAKQMQIALDLYFDKKELYPIAITAIILGTANYSCLSENGFVASCNIELVYMKLIPTAPIPPTGNQYTYISSDGNNYQLSFTLEKINQDLGPGVNCSATKIGISCAE
ncbi:type II secretion system protein [Candidatus Kuenenbacteria bacterium]|nr:type II secretion system protein [Candidatus Kuenenbacteria bacterium]